MALIISFIFHFSERLKLQDVEDNREIQNHFKIQFFQYYANIFMLAVNQPVLLFGVSYNSFSDVISLLLYD